ncbi:ribonuclease H-like domain-containing protein [Tanacetum coccineum]
MDTGASSYLNSDSSDLYPVTQLSSLPSALMSLSSSTWNQRLGHPGDEVLRCIKPNDIDCDETFSPIVKPATIRTVLSLALTRHWLVHQLDVKNVFLNGDLSETVYMYQPLCFVYPRYPHHVCRLQRSGTNISYLLIYVDDIVLTASSTALLQKIIFSLHKDMLKCNPNLTPVDTESKHDPEGTPISDPTLYRSLASGLQYLTFTRPNLSYDVQQICLYMHDPWEPHLATLKRILRYVQGTLQFGLLLYASSGSSLVAYSDIDWVGCPATRRSTSGYCVFMGENLLSWPAKRQHTL